METKAYLGKQTFTTNSLGEKTKSIVFSPDFIYAEWKSVKQSEFYQAMMNGLKPEVVITIDKYEYYSYMNSSLKQFVRLLHPVTQESIDYTVSRTYENDSDYIDLTLIRGLEDANSEISNQSNQSQ